MGRARLDPGARDSLEFLVSSTDAHDHFEIAVRREQRKRAGRCVNRPRDEHEHLAHEIA